VENINRGIAHNIRPKINRGIARSSWPKIEKKQSKHCPVTNFTAAFRTRAIALHPRPLCHSSAV